MTAPGLMAIAGGLALLGLLGLLLRRGFLFQLLAIEVMMAGAALAFVASGPSLPDGPGAGEAMVLLVLAVAAAEAGLGLALYLRLRRLARSDDTDRLRSLRG